LEQERKLAAEQALIASQQAAQAEEMNKLVAMRMELEQMKKDQEAKAIADQEKVHAIELERKKIADEQKKLAAETERIELANRNASAAEELKAELAKVTSFILIAFPNRT
jgi:membrane-associated HD superfamily phosphohydrolase